MGSPIAEDVFDHEIRIFSNSLFMLLQDAYVDISSFLDEDVIEILH
jgi:hypothetical protein